MKIGIVYCGGCNPRYDRVALVNSLKKDLVETELELALEAVCYDLLLLVCGCSAACVSGEEYCANSKFVVSSHRDFNSLCKHLIEMR